MACKHKTKNTPTMKNLMYRIENPIRAGLVSGALLTCSSLSANLLITEVLDGTLAGAAPKFVEMTNVGASDYTFGTGGGLIIQSNASLDYNLDVDMTGITILAGQTVVLSASNTDQNVDFFNVYGFNPDFLGGAAAFGNGDDRYIIVDNSTGGVADPGAILDIYGVDGLDGTGEAWEYTDSYAYRLPGMTVGNGGTFDAANWFFGGVNALEDPIAGDDLIETGLIQSMTSPGVYAVPEPSTFVLMAGVLAMGAVIWRRKRQ